jgi:4a-hydroxytetrahydrobiopterin dehydratase
MATTLSDLAKRRCAACAPGTPALKPDQISLLLGELPRWAVENGRLSRTFNFKNYYETMAFVNAVAFISHKEDHHPDLEVHYNKCVVRYSTHSVGGLSDNDFICAAKVEGLLD